MGNFEYALLPVLLTQKVSFGATVRLRRVSQGCKILVDDDPLVFKVIVRNIPSRAPRDVATARNMPSAVRKHGLLFWSCRECACILSPQSANKKEVVIHTNMADVECKCKYLLCECCISKGYRRLVDTQQVRRLVQQLDWFPRKLNELLKSPRGRWHQVNLLYKMHVATEVVAAIRSLRNRSEREECLLRSFCE